MRQRRLIARDPVRVKNTQNKYRKSDKFKTAKHLYYQTHKAVCNVYVEVAHAVKSKKLIKPKQCSKCGSKNVLIQGHHHKGYDKKHRFDVVWLCEKCHHKEHATNR